MNTESKLDLETALDKMILRKKEKKKKSSRNRSD